MLLPAFPFFQISIHKALTGLDSYPVSCNCYSIISIHKALTGLDPVIYQDKFRFDNFNPQGPHGPRQTIAKYCGLKMDFNPQGPHGPRRKFPLSFWVNGYFNPQGPHGPRRFHCGSSHCLSHFNPQGPHGPRLIRPSATISPPNISIHKALTGLDPGCSHYYTCR